MNNQEMTIREMEEKARAMRRKIMDMMEEAEIEAGHVGGGLSMTDILVVLYYRMMRIDPSNPAWPERDRFVLSKGHGCLGLCPVLADRGYFPVERLATFNKLDSGLGVHPDMHKIPGIEMSTGSLGHGLAVAVGMGLAARYHRQDFRIFVMMGDGECQEGTIWEAAMAAAHHRLGNIVGIVDRNMYQVDGHTEEITAIEPLADKWRAFGWEVLEVNGHDIPAIVELFDGLDVGLHRSQPTVVIAHTLKGRGVKFMEEDPVPWHYAPMTAEQIKEARRDIDRMKPITR